MNFAAISSVKVLFYVIFVTFVSRFLPKAIADPKPDLIGDLPADILELLLGIGIGITHFDVSITVPGLLLGTATMDFNASNPLPLIDITVNQANMAIGKNGTTFFTFNQTFTNFVIPGLGSANSGTIPNVALTQGGLGTLNILSATSLDIISADYSLSVLNISVPLTGLPQSNVPATISSNILKKKK